MANIPPIRNNPATDTRQVYRKRKVAPAEPKTEDTSRLKRRLERRRNPDRRKRQMNILFDRRQNGRIRRRNNETNPPRDASKSTDSTVGKHINTTA